MFCCGIAMFISFQISILVNKFYLFVIFYVIAAFFAGVMYTFPMYFCMKYFPENKGLVCGICMGCYGMSSIIIQSISKALINPENKLVDSNGKYPDEVVLKFPDAINFLSIYALIMISIGAFFLKNKKKLYF